MRYAPFLGLWLIGVVAVAGAGILADPVIDPVEGIRLTDSYPIDGVAIILLTMTLETGFLLAILRPRTFHRSWIRAFCAVVVACVFLFISIAAIMDAPLYAHAYAQWAFLVVIILLLLAAWAVVASALAWASTRRKASTT